MDSTPFARLNTPASAVTSILLVTANKLELGTHLTHVQRFSLPVDGLLPGNVGGACVWVGISHFTIIWSFAL